MYNVSNHFGQWRMRKKRKRDIGKMELAERILEEDCGVQGRKGKGLRRRGSKMEASVIISESIFGFNTLQQVFVSFFNHQPIKKQKTSQETTILLEGHVSATKKPTSKMKTTKGTSVPFSIPF